MSFTTTLGQAIQAAGAVYVNGTLVDNTMISRYELANKPVLQIDLRSAGQSVYVVDAEKCITVDQNGDATLADEGQKMQLNFQVAAPLTEDLIAKKE